MKNYHKLILLFVLGLMTYTSRGQAVTGIKNIPVDYPTLQAAVADLNLFGVGVGGATINVPAGHVETFTSQVVLTMTANPSTIANPLVFRKNGAGINPLITAFTPGISTALDGIFILNGVDYVTIDGIDLQDNSANTTPTQLMEWGYAMLKVSGVNACQNNTIKNCSITLSNGNSASTGIYMGNHTTLSTAALVVSNISGTSSNNKFYNNSIQNCYIGYSFTGYGAGAPYDFYDQNNLIGVDGISTRRSQVVKFGGAAVAANGIVATNQNGIRVHSTYINNTGAPNSTGVMNGISLVTGINSNVNIYNDTITLISNATTSQLTGINNAMGGTGAGNTINIYNSVISGCTYTTATSGAFRGIQNTATGTYHNIYNNTVTNNTLTGTGEFSGIYDNGSSATLVLALKIYNNTISGNIKTGLSGAMYCLNANASTSDSEVYGNQIFGNSNSASSGVTYGYFNNAIGINERMYNNSIHDIIGGTGETIAVYARTGSGPTLKEIYGNSIYNITANSAGSSVGGILTEFGTLVNVHRNNIYNITNNTTGGITPAVYGINLGANVNAQTTVYNNFISELKAPIASNVNAVYGIWMQGSTSSYLAAYYNTVFLNATSTGVNFGSAAVVCGNNPLSIDLRNNILVNTSTPNGTGTTKALVRANTTLTNFNAASGYNCLYAGTPGPANLIFFDGTNSVQTLQGFKNLVGPREQSSFSSLPPFVNVSVSPYDLHLQNSVATPCESGGTPIAGFSVDFDNNARNATTPDVGADEISGITLDIASPNIQYPLLTNSGIALSRNLPGFATITDPSGINTAVGTKPRLYYKKSTEANTYAGNTAADNGWKFVEASNTASPFDFNINYSLLFSGGVVAGDIIQYFVTAQDLATIPNVGLNNGGFAVQPANVNLAAAQFPLGNTINQYIIVTNIYSGTLNVGPTETVTSLTNPGGMFDLINQGVLGGNTTLNITGDLTSETGAIALNQWAEDGAGNYTLTIQPSAAVTRTIMGSSTAASLVRFNGADRVNIDGRFNNSGMYLLFRNTSNLHNTIGYINDAQNHWLQYTIVESGNTVNTTVAGGAVLIGTTSATQGNDNITIANCEIRDRSDVPANYPAWGINCSGTSALLSQYNNNITIKNNNIHDYYLNGNFSHGLVVTTGNSNFNIDNNSFYQVTPKTASVANTSSRGMIITLGSPLAISGGFSVTNNYIGGTAPLTAGGDMTLAVANATTYQSFLGIIVTTGMIPNYIEGNVIRNMDITTNALAAATVWNPIQVAQGINSVGTLTGNIIGAPTGTGSCKITINTGNGSNSFIAGIFAVSTNGSYDIRNNTIGGVSIGGTSATGTVYCQWIQSQGTPISNCNIANNLIGSTTTPNNIFTNLPSATAHFGVRHLITSGAPLSLTSNTFQNITDNGTNATSQSYGAFMTSGVGSTAPMNISDNIFANMSLNSLPLTPVLQHHGIACQGFGGTSHTITANRISQIVATNTGAGLGYAVGIQTQGSSMGGTISHNYVNNIANYQTGLNPAAAGIYISAGLNWNINNNMVSITNGTSTANCDIYGIAEFMGAGGTLNMNYNSVYIGGSSPSGTANSQAFYRGGSDNVNLRNNLFYNEREGANAAHVAIHSFNGLNWNPNSSDYNAFVVIDTTELAIWSGTVTNFNGWKNFSTADNNSQKNITSSITVGPLFVNAPGGDLHINTSVYPGGLATPIAITVDIDNNTRSATFPAVGADEIPCPVPIVAVVSQSNTLCYGSNEGLAIITATGGISHTYSWSPVSSTTFSINNLTAGVYTVNVTNNCNLTGSLAITITQPSSITPSSAQTNVLCNGGNSGSATLSPSGGTPGYTYSWSPASSTSSVANNLSAGVQNYTITDANNCTLTGSVTITQPTALLASGSSTNACGTQSTGAISTSVSGGTPGYTYSWTPNVSTSSTAVNLTPGSYTLVAIDANSCSVSQSFAVSSNPTPTVTASTSTNLICQGSTAVLTSTASAGVSYSWTGGGSTSSIVVSPSVTTVYVVTVSYSNGCTATAQVTQSVSSCAGLAKITGNASIQTYPNPTNGQFFVSYYGFNDGAFIEVYNTVGQAIIKKKVENLVTEINLNDLANGVYIVKVISAKGHAEQVTKLIKE